MSDFSKQLKETLEQYAKDYNAVTHIYRGDGIQETDLVTQSYTRRFTDLIIKTIEEQVIGKDEKHMRTRFTQCSYFDHMEDDECDCDATMQNDLRYEQRTALIKSIKGDE